MGETGIKPIVIEEICDFARKYNVKKVILFGSRARGDFKEKSDIDLAVQGGDFIRFKMCIRDSLDIKCKMLLPKEVNEEGEEEDPRAELVQKLLEYKMYKYMSYEPVSYTHLGSIKACL